MKISMSNQDLAVRNKVFRDYGKKSVPQGKMHVDDHLKKNPHLEFLCLVEGITDKTLCAYATGEIDASFFFVEELGKEKMLKVFRQLRKNPAYQLNRLAVADRDLDDMKTVSPTAEEVFFTDCYDLEASIYFSDVGFRFFKARTKEFTNLRQPRHSPNLEKLYERLIEIAAKIGAVRNVSRELNLNFPVRAQLHGKKGHSNIERISALKEKFSMKCHPFTPEVKFNLHEFVAYLAAESHYHGDEIDIEKIIINIELVLQQFSVKEICSGHDISFLLSVFSTELFDSFKDPQSIESDLIRFVLDSETPELKLFQDLRTRLKGLTQS
jgi:Protein of unknown function (DUF4435)